MSNEISDDDKKRIENANKYSFYRAMIAFNEGAEYATIYEREQQAALQTENNIYFQERNEAWKQNAQLEAERSELRNKIQQRHDVVSGLMQKMKSTLYWHERKEEKDFLTDLLNSLKK